MTDQNDDATIRYIRSLFGVEDNLLQSIRAEIKQHGLRQMNIRPEEAQVIQLLLKAIGARRVVEVGTMFGYSGVWIVRALPPDGHLSTIERDPERAEIAQEFFQKAGAADRVSLHVGPALSILNRLSADAPYDAVFIDANKDDYPAYLSWAVKHVRVGGMIMGHNAFMGGAVVDFPEPPDRMVAGVLAFNRYVADNPHLHGTIIPIGDGITAALKIGE